MPFSKINNYNLRQSWQTWPLLRAISWRNKLPKTVLDCNLGLGNDAGIMAAYGIKVTALEIKKEIVDLVSCKLENITKNQDLLPEKLTNIKQNLTIINTDCLSFLQNTNKLFDIIYLDPMFNSEKIKSMPKKNIQWLKNHAHLDNEIKLNEILIKSIKLAKYKTVVKRSKTSPHIGNNIPNDKKIFMSNRFDIYL